MTVNVKLINLLGDKFYMTDSAGNLILNKQRVIEIGAKIAGECYSQDGWDKLSIESAENTTRREEMTLGPIGGSGNEHATPYEHLFITLEIIGPKWLMMVLNNEGQCSTSEKSARYTRFRPENGVSAIEAELYEKWMGKLAPIIEKEYGDEPYIKPNIQKKAQENARYFTSIQTQTAMIHTVPWIQLNRIASFMIDFMNKPDKTDFEKISSSIFADFVSELERLNILDKRAMSNRKERTLRIFGQDLVINEFGDAYSTHYGASFAHMAQAHRHRTIRYNMVMMEKFKFYVPPIIRYDRLLAREWERDAELVAENFPQGQLIYLNEKGTFEDFILKCKERLCSAAQLEIMQQVRATLEEYDREFRRYTEGGEYPYPLDTYLNGARCTFCDYTCANPCGFARGVDLSRTI